MNALAEVAAAGGRVWAEGGKLKYRLPKGRADLLETLRENKPAIMAELKQRTGDDDALMRRCREACQGPEVLRAFAESLAGQAVPGLSADIEKAYRWCRAELERHPEYHRVLCAVNPDSDPVLMAVGVRHAGLAVLRIDKAKYDGFELLELIHRQDLNA